MNAAWPGGERDHPRRVGPHQHRDGENRPQHGGVAVQRDQDRRPDDDAHSRPGQRADHRPAGAQRVGAQHGQGAQHDPERVLETGFLGDEHRDGQAHRAADTVAEPDRAVVRVGHGPPRRSARPASSRSSGARRGPRRSAGRGPCRRRPPARRRPGRRGRAPPRWAARPGAGWPRARTRRSGAWCKRSCRSGTRGPPGLAAPPRPGGAAFPRPARPAAGTRSPGPGPAAGPAACPAASRADSSGRPSSSPAQARRTVATARTAAVFSAAHSSPSGMLARISSDWNSQPSSSMSPARAAVGRVGPVGRCGVAVSRPRSPLTESRAAFRAGSLGGPATADGIGQRGQGQAVLGRVGAQRRAFPRRPDQHHGQDGDRRRPGPSPPAASRPRASARGPSRTARRPAPRPFPRPRNTR